MRFRRYALERIVATIAVLFLAVTAAFVICHVIGFRRLPRDVLNGDPAVAANYAHFVHQSFGDFLWQMIGHGSLGRSFFTGESAATLALEAAPVTLSVVAWGLFIGLLIAVPLGLAWDREPRWTRWWAPVFVYLAIGLLPVFAAMELGLHLGHDWELLPVGGYADFFDPPEGLPGGPVQWAYHLILPGFVLGLPIAAIYSRVVRAMARNVRRAREETPEADRVEAVRSARTTGLIVVAKGLLRDVGLLIGAAAFVESGFGLPGLGRTVVVATTGFGDAPLVEGTLILATVIAVTIHLAGNLIGGGAGKQWRSGS
jgi:peptide/nickel transport system permease protein